MSAAGPDRVQSEDAEAAAVEHRIRVPIHFELSQPLLPTSSLAYLAPARRRSRHGCPRWAHHATQALLVMATAMAVMVVSPASPFYYGSSDATEAVSETPPSSFLCGPFECRQPTEAEAELLASIAEAQHWVYVTSIAAVIIFPLTLFIVLLACWPCYPDEPSRKVSNRGRLLTDDLAANGVYEDEDVQPIAHIQFPGKVMLYAATAPVSPPPRQDPGAGPSVGALPPSKGAADAKAGAHDVGIAGSAAAAFTV